MGLFQRDISVEVEEDGEGIILLRGRLADRRYGEDLHILEAEMRVSALDGVILDINASMPTVPMPECREALDSVRGLSGEIIQPGFSDRVKALVGSKRGCTHLASLIMNMGNVSVQGRAAYARKHLTEAQAARRMEETSMQLGLLDSCVCWREDGPVVQRWREQQRRVLEEDDARE